jgi:hypothetical protein
MHSKPNITIYNNKKKIKNKTIKTKQGGQEFKHKRVSLFYKQVDTEYPINCEVCSNNDYILRTSTLGKSKGNQVTFNFFFNDSIFEDLNNISIITYVCRICSMCKIVRDDQKNYIYTKELT